MESGVILDSQISASSVWRADHAAQQARLHFKAGGGKTGSWSSRYNNINQWLQVDLQQTTRVTGIATQGRNASPQWVTKYKLQYEKDGQTLTFYRQNGDNSDTVHLFIKSVESYYKGRTCITRTLFVNTSRLFCFLKVAKNNFLLQFKLVVIENYLIPLSQTQSNQKSCSILLIISSAGKYAYNNNNLQQQTGLFQL